MSLYGYLQRLKYKITAKTRHGIHSPFVYDFIEVVLRDHSNFSYTDKLNKFFGAAHIVYIQSAYPKLWAEILARETQEAKEQTVIILPDIYKTAVHTEAWQRAKQLPGISMSIDIYKYGILLFRSEFKERQDFIVKD